MRKALREPADPHAARCGPARRAALPAGLCALLLLACSPPAPSPGQSPDETPPRHAGLPLEAEARAALEGQRVVFDGKWLLSDVYAARDGRWTLASEPIFIPTEQAAPGQPAREAERRNRDRMLEVALPGAPSPALPAGTAILDPQGKIGFGERAHVLALERLPKTGPAAWPEDPPEAGGALRLVSMNLLNYFNGDGLGGGFPTERGAETPQEFDAQGARLGAAIGRIRPDLLAVQELENNGFGPHSAARSLLGLLSGTVGGDWAVIDPGTGPVGGDVITVGLFYRRDRLEPMGAVETLAAQPFQGLSRQPLAQRFRDPDGGSLWVVVNHLKSKGSCPETGPNRDRGDGQGCWSAARTDAVRALTSWLEELVAASGEQRVLILGDMNSWRQEEPIQAFRRAGYHELVEERSGLPQYSYRYFGQAGTLDYAFASPALRPRATRALIWHINADMPPDLELPLPWLRASDHDPVIVDLDFSQAATSD